MCKYRVVGSLCPRQLISDLKYKRRGKAQKSAVATENTTVLLLTECRERLQLEINQGEEKHRKRILKEEVQRWEKGDRKADRIKKKR